NPRPVNTRKIRPREKEMTADSALLNFCGLSRSSNHRPQQAAASKIGTLRAASNAEPLRKTRIAPTTTPALNQTRSARARHKAIDVIWAEMTARRIHAQSRSAPLLNGCRSAFRTVSTYLAVIATNQRRVINLVALKIRSWTADN